MLGGHLFTASGTYEVVVSVRDVDGDSLRLTGAALISDVNLETDPTNPAQTELAVGGTTGDDLILIVPGQTPGTVYAVVNGAVDGPYSPTGRIVVYGQAGNDIIGAAPQVTQNVWVFAGSGNNFIVGGGGNNVLVGGSGNDTLVAGPGRDILIGGAGADLLAGGTGDDLIIGGSTAYDANDAALAAILAEWASGDSLAVRMADILDQNPSSTRLNGNYFFLPAAAGGLAATVFDDFAADTFVAGAGNDWLFGEFVLPSGTNSPPVDSIVAGTGTIAKAESDALSSS